MTDRAVISVCSSNLGPYVNAISYLFDRRGIRSFVFLFITDVSAEAPSNSLALEILSAFDNLGSTGCFWDSTVDPPAELNDNEARLFLEVADCLEASAESPVTVSIDQLTTALDHWKAESLTTELVLDITGLPKVVAAQVTAICVTSGHAVSMFDLRTDPKGKPPVDLLYGRLSEGDSDYTRLNREPAVQSSLRRLVSIRRALMITGLAMIGGLAALAIVLVVDRENITFVALAVSANLVGIAGTTYQLVVSRR